MDLLQESSWGPSSHGIKVKLNQLSPTLGPIVAVDVETDEHDNVIGGAVFDGGTEVYYYSTVADLITTIQGKRLVGHNLKGDLNWLNQYATKKFTSIDIEDDTMILSYIENSNKDSHGLKNIAKEILGWTWPSYRDMVGKGSKKVTLDRQDVEKVAEYCSMDTIATWMIRLAILKRLSGTNLKLYQTMELPVYRMLWDMECLGVKIDLALLNQLDKEFGDEVTLAEAALRVYDWTWNANSPKQTVAVLNKYGIHVVDSKKDTLIAYRGHPKDMLLIHALLKYRKIKKLHSTYIVSIKERGTDIVHTTFNQVASKDDGTMHGIRTGRLSSSDPNLQNIPRIKKGEEYGRKLRSLFVPRQGKIYIDADYSQIEYRLLAHFSQEPTLIESFKKGLDVHATTGQLLASGNPNARDIGKTLNFAAIYGAQAQKISNTAGVTEAEAEQFLKSYWLKLPGVTRWIASTKMVAKSKQNVCTMAGRTIPLPDLVNRNKWKQAHAERAAINYIIQGSAADIIKVAMLELNKQGYFPLVQVHDELIFELDRPKNIMEIRKHYRKIKNIMENVVQLTIPIVVDAHIGRTWAQAKG